MADWYGAARSNYVKIKDLDGLKKALDLFNINTYEAPDGLVCLICENSDFGGWPTYILNEEDEDEEFEFNPTIHICPFMEADQILVMIESGAEKLRYITGNAQAYNAAGDVCSINLYDIYSRAAAQFGVPLEKITLAEY